MGAKKTTSKRATVRKLPVTRSAQAATPPTRRPRRRRHDAPPAADEAVVIEEGSGNVFADLGFADAGERLAKAELARIVRALVRERQARDGWTQARAGKALGIPAPDMSDLMRGKLARFSRERLEQFLTHLDMEVRIQVGPRPAGSRRAGIVVEQVVAFA